MATTAKSPVVPPLAFRFASVPSSQTAAATLDDSRYEDDYVALFAGVTPPPLPDSASFQGDNGPLSHLKVPRHSTLPGARAAGCSGRDFNAHAASGQQAAHKALAAQ